MPFEAALAEFDRIRREVGLWPGFRPEAIPLVLHGDGQAYLIGHPAPPEGYHAAQPVAGRTVHVGPATPDMSANTAQAVGGVLCALAELPAAAADLAVYARLLLHECFHVFQQTGLSAVAQPDYRLMSRYPENDPVNNALAQVENGLLSAALTGDAAAPARFLAVRRFRQGRLEPELAAYEMAQEYNEGTPTYIELKAGRPVAEVASLLAQCNVGGKWAAYRRFYFTGGALALLLDRVSAGWQERFAAGGTTLQELLAAVAGPVPAAEEVLRAVGYEALLAAEHERDAERRRQIADLIAGLESGPGVRVEIDPSGAPYFAWDPTRCLVVEPGVRLHTRWFCLQDGGATKVEITGISLEDRIHNVVVTRVAEAPVVTSQQPFRVAALGLKGEAPRGSLEPAGDGGYRIRLG